MASCHKSPRFHGKAHLMHLRRRELFRRDELQIDEFLSTPRRPANRTIRIVHHRPLGATVMTGLFDDLRPAAPAAAASRERLETPGTAPRNRIEEMIAGAAPMIDVTAPSNAAAATNLAPARSVEPSSSSAPARESVAASPVAPAVAPARAPRPAGTCSILPIRTPRAPRPVPVTPRAVGFYRPKPRKPLFSRRELLHAALTCGAVALVGITLARLVFTNW